MIVGGDRTWPSESVFATGETLDLTHVKRAHNKARGKKSALIFMGVGILLVATTLDLGLVFLSLFAILPLSAFVYSYFSRVDPVSTHGVARAAALGLEPGFEVTGEIVGVNGSGILVDQKRRRLIVYSDKANVYDMSALMRSEVFEDGGGVSSTVRSSQVLGAAVGAALLGGAGLLLGGLSGKKRNDQVISSVSLGVTVNDASNALTEITFLKIEEPNKPLKRSSPEAKKAIDAVRQAHAVVSVLIRQEDDEAAKALVKEQAKATMTAARISHQAGTSLQAPTEKPSMADTLERLHKLHVSGAINAEEFAALKAKAMA